MGNTTSNTSPLIRGHIYSQMLQDELLDALVATKLTWDVSDFGDGTTYHIPSIGDVIVRDYSEDTPIIYDSIDTGEVTMTLDQYKSAASYVTKKLLLDGYKAQALYAAIPRKHLRALLEEYETRLFRTANAGQTAGNANSVNGQAHRFVASGTSQHIQLDDLNKMKISLDLANVPQVNRCMFIDPRGELDFNRIPNIINVDSNPQFQGIIETGFARDTRFVRNVYGIDIYTNNRLPDIASETIGSTVTNGKAAILLGLADPDVMALMSAWRQMPTTEGEWNKDLQREEYVTTAYYGFGVKRKESMCVLLHNITNVS